MKRMQGCARRKGDARSDPPDSSSKNILYIIYFYIKYQELKVFPLIDASADCQAAPDLLSPRVAAETAPETGGRRHGFRILNGSDLKR